MATIIILAIVGYWVFHTIHSVDRYRRSSHLTWHKRIWVSLPGPWGTRISREV